MIDPQHSRTLVKGPRDSATAMALFRLLLDYSTPLAAYWIFHEYVDDESDNIATLIVAIQIAAGDQYPDERFNECECGCVGEYGWQPVQPDEGMLQ